MLQHIRPALSSYVADFEVTAAAAAKKDPAIEIAKVERKMKKLYDLFMDDLIDKASYRSEYEKFQSQIDKLRSCPAAPVRNLDSIKKMLSVIGKLCIILSRQENMSFGSPSCCTIICLQRSEKWIIVFYDLVSTNYAPPVGTA